MKFDVFLFCFLSVVCGLSGCGFRQGDGPTTETNVNSRAVDLLANSIREEATEPGRVALVGIPQGEESDWAERLRSRLQSRLQSEDPAWRVVHVAEADALGRWPEGWTLAVAMDGEWEAARDMGISVIAVVDQSEVSSYLQQVYRASALMEMSVRGPRILTNKAQQDFGKTEEVFNTRLGRLRSTRFGVLAEERFLALWEAHGRPVPDGERPNPGKISYNMIRQSRLVQISAESPDPLVAAISANAAAEAASTFFQEENRDLSDSAVQWLNRQTDVQKTQLKQTEDALLAFRSENNLDTLRAQLDADKQSLKTLNSMLIGYDNKLLRAKESLKSIEDLAINLDKEVKLPLSLPNRDRILNEVQRYRNALNERAMMLDLKPAKHPDVVMLDRRIRDLAKSIKEEVELSKGSFVKQINVIEQQRQAVSNKIEEMTQKLARQELHLVERDARLRRLIRERDAAEAALNSVLSRIEQARLAADEDTATLILVERAIVPDKPARRVVSGLSGVLVRVKGMNEVVYDWIQ